MLAVYSKWEKSRDQTFLDLLEFSPNANVVDLGCGDGRFSIRAEEKVGRNVMLGIDVSEKSVKKAEERGMSVRRADLNGTLPLKNGSFDVVISNQVIEHLFYPVKFMREVYRILKSGGYAVISTENLSSWDNLFAIFLGYTPFSIEFDSGLRKIGNPFSPHEKEVIRGYTYSHVRIFAWRGLIELANLLGFSVERVEGSGHFFGGFGELIDRKHCRFITVKLRKTRNES